MYKKVLQPGYVTIEKGNVVLRQRAKLRVPCTLTPKGAFTHEGRVNCTVELGSYGYVSEEVELAWNSEPGVKDTVAGVVKLRSSKTTVNVANLGLVDKLLLNLEIQTMFGPNVLRFIGSQAIEKFS